MAIGLADPGFVWRTRELATLEAGLTLARSGRGGIIMVAGEAGIGKTRLATEFAARAAGAGASVLWGRCFQGDSARPYGPWVEAIARYDRMVPPDRLRALAGPGIDVLTRLVSGVWAASPDARGTMSLSPDEERLRLYEAVAGFLCSSEWRGPLVLVLDDLHWADSASLALLRYVAHALTVAPILIVGAYRDGEVGPGHALDGLLPILRHEAPFEHVAVTGLSVPETSALLLAMSGQVAGVEPVAGLDRLLAEAVHTHTGGNPYFVGELFRHLAATGRVLVRDGLLTAEAEPTTWGVSEGVRQVVSGRLAGLSAGTRRILEQASVFAGGFDFATMRALTGWGEDDLLDALDEALWARFLRVMDASTAPAAYDFVHAIVRQTLYDAMNPDRRARLHLRAARAIEACHVDNVAPHLGALAVHYRLAQPLAGLDNAITYSRQAGTAAAAVYAWKEAAEHWRAASELSERRDTIGAPASADENAGWERQRCELLLDLGDAEARSGDAWASRRTFLRAAEAARMLVRHGTAGAAQLLGRAALGLGGRFVWASANDERLVEHLQEALAAIGEADSPVRATLLARLSTALPQLRDTMTWRDQLSRRAVAMARRIGDDLALAFALDTRFMALWTARRLEDRLAVASEMLRLAERAGDRERQLQAHHWRFIVLMDAGDIAGAGAAADAQARLADELRQPSQFWYTLVVRATHATFAGRLDDAEHLIGEAARAGQQAEEGLAASFFLRQTFGLRRHQGRLDEVAAELRQGVNGFPQIPLLRAMLATALAESGRLEEAQAQFEHLAEQDFDDIPPFGSWLFTVCLLADVCCLLNDAARARLLYGILAPYAGRNVMSGPTDSLGSTDRPLGRLATTIACVETPGSSAASRWWAEAERHFEAARTLNERMASRPWLARTLTEHADVLIVRHEHGRMPRETAAHAANLLNRAGAIARDLGMARTLAQIDHARARLQRFRGSRAQAASHGPRLTPGGLTPRELDVLRLVAAGCSNQEIAADLVLSVRTVERHIAGVYDKIGTCGKSARAVATAYALTHGLVDLARPDV